MTRKRSKEEMCEQILRQAGKPEGIAPSEVTQNLSISWISYQELVPKMLKEGLLRQLYNQLYTEQRGFKYIDAREKLKELLQV